jgi:hypothetical protein
MGDPHWRASWLGQSGRFEAVLGTNGGAVFGGFISQCEELSVWVFWSQRCDR